MAPGGEMFRYPKHFGENVLRHGSHEWLPYSKNAVRTKSSNNNLSDRVSEYLRAALWLDKAARNFYVAAFTCRMTESTSKMSPTM